MLDAPPHFSLLQAFEARVMAVGFDGGEGLHAEGGAGASAAAGVASGRGVRFRAREGEGVDDVGGEAGDDGADDGEAGAEDADAEFDGGPGYDCCEGVCGGRRLVSALGGGRALGGEREGSTDR